MEAENTLELNDLELDLNFNLDDFSGIEVDLEDNFETRYIKPPQTKQTSEYFLKYENAEKLAKNIAITPDCRYFVIVNGSFIFGDFIEAIIIENNWKVKRLTISTLSMSENNVDSLAGLLEMNYVQELNLIISDHFFSHERGNLIPYIYEQLDVEGDRFQLAVAGTHCKKCLIETVCGKFVFMHGSANLRSSGNIEQFEIEEGKLIYDFNLEYQEAILEKFKTINKDVQDNLYKKKSIRHKKLWDLIKE